ncbi:hypothetical protein L484_013927 [Morus notabilis]|uniref:Uncharacterized protein n=1 Tax=Morus notabilis TaxID=981085 RepID=W9R556_9ROSA|nr:uncharacterized protein LOC21397088 [Morus notabilis]EXB38294.1 hypothetical protein L484_013927 [Morus notabilis]
MGQSLKKFAPGSEENKMKDIVPIIEKRYTKHFGKGSSEPNLADFYGAVCETVEEINKTFGNTQFKVPSARAIREAYQTHHEHKKEPVTREEFQKILQEILITDSGFTGLGAKDTLVYIFGVPLAALFVKQKLFPRAVPNEVFIPGVTSATVFVLAKLNKI